MIERLPGGHELGTNAAVVKAATRLYYDPSKGWLKRGAQPCRFAELPSEIDRIRR